MDDNAGNQELSQRNRVYSASGRAVFSSDAYTTEQVVGAIQSAQKSP